MTPFLLLLVTCFSPSISLATSQVHSSSAPPRRYYYKKMPTSHTPSSQSQPARQYYYKPFNSDSSPPSKTQSKKSSVLQKLMYKKVSAVAGWMDKAASKYFKHVPHSGKYPGKENPLTGDPYPWSKKTGKYETSGLNSGKVKTSSYKLDSAAGSAVSKTYIKNPIKSHTKSRTGLMSKLKSYLPKFTKIFDTKSKPSHASLPPSVQTLVQGSSSEAEVSPSPSQGVSSASIKKPNMTYSSTSSMSSTTPVLSEGLQSIEDVMDSILHLPQGLSDFWKSQLVQSDSVEEDSATMEENLSQQGTNFNMTGKASSEMMDSEVEDLINVVYSDMPMDNLLHDAIALSPDKSDPTSTTSNPIQEFGSSSDLTDEDSLEPITETTMKMPTPEDETASPFSDNPIPEIVSANDQEEVDLSQMEAVTMELTTPAVATTAEVTVEKATQPPVDSDTNLSQVEAETMEMTTPAVATAAEVTVEKSTQPPMDSDTTSIDEEGPAPNPVIKRIITTRTYTSLGLEQSSKHLQKYFRKDEEISDMLLVPEMNKYMNDVSPKTQDSSPMYFSKQSVLHSKFYDTGAIVLSSSEPIQESEHEEQIAVTHNTEGVEESEGVLVYLVSDPSNPGSEFLVPRSALIQSGLVLNKIVHLSAWTVAAGGQVEIVSSSSFHLTGLHYDGPGPASWMAGTTFPIGLHSSTVVLAPWTAGVEETDLSLPGQLTVADINWLALYCRTCVEGERVVMQVYVPETFL